PSRAPSRKPKPSRHTRSSPFLNNVVPRGANSPDRRSKTPRIGRRTLGNVDRLHRALGAIDAANADDPTIVTARERTGPKEIVHAELVSAWVRRLVPEPDVALVL